MPIHWTLTLHCADCGAAITYTDPDRPAWQMDAPDPELIAAAEAWLAEHPRADWFKPNGLPAYVTCSPFGNYVSPPPTVYYVDCPACGGRAEQSSGLAPVADAEPNAVVSSV